MEIIDLGNGAECKIDADAYKVWYLNGNLHRTDGPAIECANGDKEWCLNGKYHSCLLYTSPSPRDRTRSRMPSSA